MRIRELRDWRSYLDSIRHRLVYSNFKATAQQAEEHLGDHALLVSMDVDRDIARGMLHTVVSLPQAEEASAQVEQFAAELERLQPDPTAGTESGATARAYRQFWDEVALTQRGLPAVVEAFRLYAEGRCNLRQEPRDLLREAQRRVQAEPQVALRLAGEAGCLCFRGLEDVESLQPKKGERHLKGALADWIAAISGVIAHFDELEEYPLGEVELARDQWRAPDDDERIEYKKGKLARLGIVEPEVEGLLLPLLTSASGLPLGAERKAIVGAGAKVVPGLIAIAGNDDSQLQSSVSGGEAAIIAVQLLGDIRAAEAVPTLLDILENSEWMTIIHDQTLQVLQDKMPDLAFDAALELFDHATDVEFKSALAGVLAKGGKEKPGVFERLIEFFRKEKKEQGIVASYLADLGDPRALPDLQAALRRSDGWFGRGDFEEAIVELGGEVSTAEKQKTERIRTRLLAPPHPAKPPQPAPVAPQATIRVTKIGRNEPCPCGSGKKYKKCCGR